MSVVLKLVESIESNKSLLDELCGLYGYDECEREVVAEVLLALAFKELQGSNDTSIKLPKITIHSPIDIN